MTNRLLPDLVLRRLDPEQRYGLRVTLFALAAILALAPFSYVMIDVINGGELVELDREFAGPLNDVFARSETLAAFAKVMTFLGSPLWFYLTVGGAALWFLKRGSRRVAAFLAITGLVGGLINSSVKLVVARPRPDITTALVEAQGKSFPSGHTMLSTVCYGALLLAFMPLIPRRARPFAISGYFVLVILIGGSRLALGVHYISDVLGGFILGLAWLALSTAAFSIWREERGRPAVDVTEGVEPEAAG